MTLQMVDFKKHWTSIENGVYEITEKYDDYTVADLMRMLFDGLAQVLLDPAQDDEFYIVNLDHTTGKRIFHVWQAYSKNGDFLKRTYPELENIAKNWLKADMMTFVTNDDKGFDIFIKNGTIGSFKKEPSVYKLHLMDEKD